jgi:hypothetical protein
MKRVLILLLVTVAAVGATWKAQQSATTSAAQPVTALSRYVPGGALLYLQATNFSVLLADWDKSAEKRNWLESHSYEEFSNSRLFLRLTDAAKEFSSAAGVPTDSKLLRQVAGAQSALAIYDVGKLEFVYITRLRSGSAMQSALWQTRSKFETRSAGNAPFFVRKDSQSGREVAFAVAGDYLLLATSEELLAGALRLLAKENVPAMHTEAWWSQSVAVAGGEGDLRMVLNLEKIVSSPYFRSYWIQRNIPDMRQYSAAVSDLFRSRNEFREERVLLRRVPTVPDEAVAHGAADAGETLRYVPADVGLYQVQANPSEAECVAALETKIFSGRSGATREEKLAPQVQLTSGEAGGSTDWEARIDRPLVQSAPGASVKSPLRELFAQNAATALLQVQSTDLDKDSVFVRVHSAVILRGVSDWNEFAVKSSLVDFAQADVTAQEMGFAWQKDGGQLQLNGLWTLTFVIRGKYLLLSNNAELLAKILAVGDRQTLEPPAAFVAGFDFPREQENFEALTHVLDISNRASTGNREPNFFSDTMGSLSSALRKLSSEKIVVRDQGATLHQTVTYIWAR